MRTIPLLFLALALLAACRHTHTSTSDTEKPSEAGAAFGWWAMARTFPDGRFYTEKYEQAMAQMHLEAQWRGGPVWEPIGPNNIGGRTLCIALHPQDTNVMWAGSASGGIWRSQTAGRGAAAWQRVETGFPLLGVSALAIDPTNPNVLYAGTGEVYNLENSAPNVAIRTTRGTYGIGILKTEDGGATWKKSLDWAYGDLRGVQDIQINPLRPATVYAATTEGLLRSYDAGKTWKTVHNRSMAVDIALHPTDTSRIFVTHGSLDDQDVSGIFRSTDGGKTFQHLTNGLPTEYSGKTLLSICTSTPSIMYASVGNAFNQVGLFSSDDGGDTWVIFNSQNVCSYQGWYSHDVSVHPNKPAEISWVGIDAWHSTNNGIKVTRRSFWNKRYFGLVPAGDPEGPSDYAHADIHQIHRSPKDPNKVYYATDGGIFVSYDGGLTFSGRNGGYQTQQFYANFGNSTSDPKWCIGGMQDNSTAIYSGLLSWTRVLGGDGQCAAIQPGNDAVMFGSSQYLNMYRSEDGGASFQYITPQEINEQNTAFNGPFEIAPSEPLTMYAGAQSLFRSTDMGDTWENISGPDFVADDDVVLSIAIDPQNPNLTYFSTAPTATSEARLFKFEYGGAGLTPLSGLPNRLCMDIAIHPKQPNTVFAALAGFNVAHVWRSDDGGATWQTSDAGLPDVPTNSLLLDPDQPSQMYVGNDLGVWHSTDGGQSWSLYSATAPQAMLAMHLSAAPGRKLRVATYGLGVWQTDMAPIVSAAEPRAGIDFQNISPNPAHDVLNVAFVLTQKENVTLEVLDLSGRTLQTLLLGPLAEGRHEHPVEVASLPAGTYGLLLRSARGKAGRLWVKG